MAFVFDVKDVATLRTSAMVPSAANFGSTLRTSRRRLSSHPIRLKSGLKAGRPWPNVLSRSTGSRIAFRSLLVRAGWTPPAEDGLFVPGRAALMVDAVGRWSALSERLAVPGSYRFAPIELSVADHCRVDRLLTLPEATDMRGPVAPAERLVLWRPDRGSRTHPGLSN